MHATKPVMIYDADCSFCRIWIEYWKQITRGEVMYFPFQEVAADYPEIPIENFQRSVQLVKPDGTTMSGARAVLESLATNPSMRWLLRLYMRIPGISGLFEAFYLYIARHRNGANTITRILWGRNIEVSTGYLSRWLFLRMLGVVYLIAFISLTTQIIGLVGEHGILPVRDFLRFVSENAGASRFWVLPTLSWLDASDGFLRFMCWSGIGFSVLLICGVAQRYVSILLYLLYL